MRDTVGHPVAAAAHIELMELEGRCRRFALANAILYMDSLPLDANVQFTTVMATKMPFVGRG